MEKPVLESVELDLPEAADLEQPPALSNHERKQSLTNEHFDQIYNTVLNLGLLEPYRDRYKQIMKVDVPYWDSGDSKCLLVLDVDETMVRVEALEAEEQPNHPLPRSPDPPSEPSTLPHHLLDIPHDTVPGKLEKVKVTLRPHLLESLGELAQKFHLVSFTASE